MLVRRRAGIRRQLNEENGEEIVAAVEMAEGAVEAVTRPGFTSAASMSIDAPVWIGTPSPLAQSS